MIDLNKKLNKQNFYLYDQIEDVDTVGTFITDILNYGCEFYYKNVDYYIEWWKHEKDGVWPWAIQTNADQLEDIPYSYVVFDHNKKEEFIKVLETFKLHDGTLFYDAITKRGRWKDFIYDDSKNTKKEASN